MGLNLGLAARVVTVPLGSIAFVRPVSNRCGFPLVGWLRVRYASYHRALCGKLSLSTASTITLVFVIAPRVILANYGNPYGRAIDTLRTV